MLHIHQEPEAAQRVLQIVFTVFPFIDEGIALPLNGFPVFFYPGSSSFLKSLVRSHVVLIFMGGVSDVFFILLLLDVTQFSAA